MGGSATMVLHAFLKQVHHVLIACCLAYKPSRLNCIIYIIATIDGNWPVVFVPNSELVICTFCYALLSICMNQCFWSVTCLVQGQVSRPPFHEMAVPGGTALETDC